MINVLSYMLLAFCYLVAAGFAVRIIRYRRTGDKKYKHDYNCWANNYTGKHTRKGTK